MARRLIRASITWENGAYHFKALFQEPGRADEEHNHEFRDRSSLTSFLADVLPEKFSEEPQVDPSSTDSLHDQLSQAIMGNNLAKAQDILDQIKAKDAVLPNTVTANITT